MADNVLKVYKDKLKTFKQNAEIMNGIKSVPAFGHTPGHTMFLISDGAASVMVLGDIVHARMQFAHPEVYLTYDVDPATAVNTRKKVFKEVSDSKLPVAGMHVYGGGAGKVTSISPGSYTFTPGM